jgi:hypothetical protein
MRMRTPLVAVSAGADGSIDFVPVKGRTVADAVRTADAMPGTLGHAFDQPVAVGAMSNDPLRFLEWDLDTLHIDDVRPLLPARPW